IAAYEGNYGVFVDAAQEACCSQSVAAKAGVLYHASAYLKGYTSPGARAYLHVGFTDAQGAVLANHKIWALPYGDSPWARIHFWLRAPEGAAKVFIALCVIGQVPGDHVAMDDCVIEAL
ncbi:MAG TPA: hypothetical protein PLV25_03810, partial [Opitutales bacterium]|nr:hypothetical protein [Opitutales bacterium]